MANHASHAALPYPIKGARFTLLVPMLDADGDPTAATTPDTEISEDNAAATDCAEEISATSGMDGMAMLTLTGAETDCSCFALNFKNASGPKASLGTFYPRVLASIGTGTLAAGSAGGGTLGTILAYDVTGCFIRTTGGTGGGGTGGANNQARKIATYNTTTGAFTVVPNWETAPSTDTTYELHLPEGVTLGMLRALNPATPGRTLVVDAAGLADANAVKIGPTGSGTAQTAADVGSLVAKFTGMTNIAQWLGLIAGKQTGNSTARTELRATGAGSGTFDETTDSNEALRDRGDAAWITATGFSTHSAADVWAVGTRILTAGTNIVLAKGTGVTGFTDLSAAQVNAEVDTALADIHLDHLIASADPGGVVADSSFLAKLVSKSGTPSFASYSNATDSLEALRDRGDAAWITATGFSTHSAADVWAVATRVLTANTNLNDPTAATVAAAVWDLATSGHTNSGTFGEAMQAAGSAGDPWATALPGAYGVGSAGKIVGDGLDAAVSSRSSHSAADVWAVGTRTLSSFGSLVSDISTAVWGAATRILTAATNITSTGGTTVPQSGDSFARLGLPAGASISADIAAVKADAVSLLTNLAALAGKFTGITLLAHWLGLIAGKQTPNATALTEIKATGAGSGTFDPTTDSNEALRDTAPMGTAMRGTDSAMLASSYTAPDNVSAAAAASASAAVKVVTDKLATAIELDGAVYRFTTNALEMAPAGGGGGGGSTMATAIPSIGDTSAGSQGEALRAILNLTRGKRTVVNTGTTAAPVWKLRIYHFDNSATIWATLDIDHPVAPSSAVPA